jgi:hypothetical protein
MTLLAQRLLDEAMFVLPGRDASESVPGGWGA